VFLLPNPAEANAPQADSPPQADSAAGGEPSSAAPRFALREDEQIPLAPVPSGPSAPPAGGTVKRSSPLTVSSPATPENFWRALPGALKYPFAGNGTAILIGGVIVFSVAQVLMMFLFIVGILFSIFIIGYVFGYLLTIIQDSAMGKSEPPDWPEMRNMDDAALMPFLEALLLGVVCFLPAVLCRYRPIPNAPLVSGIALFAGLLYLPMGMIGIAMTDSVAGVSPHIVLRAILSVPLRYSVTWVAVVLAVLAGAYGQNMIEIYLPIPLLTIPLHQAIFLYSVFVASRVMGQLCWSARDKLDWLF
jgi:hypothetical protein